MDKLIVGVSIGAFWILVCSGQAQADERPWQHVKAMPFVVRSGLEIARQAQGKAPASLYVVCSQTDELHLILSTRLPAPRWTVLNSRDENVSLFVGGIDHEFKLVMDLVDKGTGLTWPQAALSHEGEGAPDTLVTTTISANGISKIGVWFGDAPPAKVSIVGYSETGVFMAGQIAGPAIIKFSASCVAQ